MKRTKERGTSAINVLSELGGGGGVKTIISLFVVALQFAVIVSLYFYFTAWVNAYMVICFAVSVITALCVLSSSKNPRSKCVWIAFVLIFFPFGFVVYFLSTERVAYVRSRKKHENIINKTKLYLSTNCSTDLISPTCKMLINSGFRAYDGENLTYFPSGTTMFDSVLERMEQAKRFIFIEFYIISDGILLQRMLRLIKSKLSCGVEVRIICDDVGSRRFSSRTIKEIRKLGGKVEIFNKLLSRFSFSMNYRDHRKIIVIDGEVAYTGGANVADEYINEKRVYGYWKDTGVKIEGEAVNAFTLFFLRQWEFITSHPENYEKFIVKYNKDCNANGVVIPFVGFPSSSMPICKNVYEQVISSARERAYIMTPYFIPDDGLEQTLIRASLSGVDVRLLLPAVPDKNYVYRLTVNNAEKLKKYGVKIYYYAHSFVHGKVIVTEKSAVVGSANFDLRSFYQQYESALYVEDDAFIKTVTDDFLSTFKDCELSLSSKKQNVIRKIEVCFLQLFSPLL